MKEEDKRKFEELIRYMQCPNGLECIDFGFENLYAAKDIGLNYYLECIKDNPTDCSFAYPFGDLCLCHCPVRMYIAKKLKK